MDEGSDKTHPDSKTGSTSFLDHFRKENLSSGKTTSYEYHISFINEKRRGTVSILLYKQPRKDTYKGDHPEHL